MRQLATKICCCTWRNEPHRFRHHKMIKHIVSRKILISFNDETSFCICLNQSGNVDNPIDLLHDKALAGDTKPVFFYDRTVSLNFLAGCRAGLLIMILRESAF